MIRPAEEIWDAMLADDEQVPKTSTGANLAGSASLALTPTPRLCLRMAVTIYDDEQVYRGDCTNYGMGIYSLKVALDH